jgi:hypothetical protein
MRLAGRFSRRIHGYAKAYGLPVVHCSAVEGNHELAAVDRDSTIRTIASKEYIIWTQLRDAPYLVASRRVVFWINLKMISRSAVSRWNIKH